MTPETLPDVPTVETPTPPASTPDATPFALGSDPAAVVAPTPEASPPAAPPAAAPRVLPLTLAQAALTARARPEVH